MKTTLLWLFGCSALAAVCNFPSWVLLLHRWFKDRRDIERLTMRTGMVFGCFGLICGSWARASQIYRAQTLPLPPIYYWTPFGYVEVPGWAPLIWMSALCVAEVLYLITSAVTEQKTGTRHRAPLVFMVVISIWTMFILTRA